MARYYFHLRDGSDHILDPVGIELTDLEAAVVVALRAARDSLSNDIKGGSLDLRYRIDVENEGGSVVHSLPFRDAFEVTSAA